MSAPKRPAARKCQECKTRKAIWKVGSDGFNAKRGRLVCDTYACRSNATGGYPVTLHRIDPVGV